jgi:hypothetical protein
MVASDAIGANQGGKTVRPSCGRELLDFAGAGRCVVRAWSFAGNIVLKLSEYFPRSCSNPIAAARRAAPNFWPREEARVDTLNR